MYTRTLHSSGPMRCSRALCFLTHLFFIDWPVLVGGTWVVTWLSFWCHGGSANLLILSVFVSILWLIRKRLVHLAFFIWHCCLLAVDVCAPMGLCGSWNGKPSSVVIWEAVCYWVARVEVICHVSLAVIYIVKELWYRGHGGFNLHHIDQCCAENPQDIPQCFVLDLLNWVRLGQVVSVCLVESFDWASKHLG